MKIVLAGHLALTVLWGGIAHGQADHVLQQFPFEIVLDVTWQGRDIRIRKVLNCSMRERVHPFIWDQDVKRVAHVLPNGEALIVGVPTVCGGLNRSPKSTSLEPLPENYLPFVYWIDNAKDPSRAELIVSARYFKENPQRRFVLHRFSSRLVLDEPSENVDTDGHGLTRLIDTWSMDFDHYFVAVPVTAIPKSVWGGFPALRALLATKSTSSQIEVEAIRKSAWQLLQTCTHRFQGIGEAACPLSFDDRHGTIGAVRDRSVWRVLDNDIGVVRYERLIAAREVDTTGCNAAQRTCNLHNGSFEVNVRGQTVSSPKFGEFFFFFDHSSKLLFRYRYSLSSSASPKNLR